MSHVVAARNLLVLPIFFLLLVGCGRNNPEMYRVRGTLTHQGTPIPGLYLVFKPDDLTRYAESVAVTDAEGRFDLMVGSTPGVFPGPHTVFADDPLAVQGAKTSEDPGYLAVVAKYGPDVSEFRITIDKELTDLELKFD